MRVPVIPAQVAWRKKEPNAKEREPPRSWRRVKGVIFEEIIGKNVQSYDPGNAGSFKNEMYFHYRQR
jgi:hypothetical protein